MRRHFEDFLSAYFEYAQDGFCPDAFHMWTGISCLAGALERKVWLFRQSHTLYANIYVLLVAKPSIGKSSATNIGVRDFLERLETDGKEVNFLATQSSEASFIEQMARYKSFMIGTQVHQHSSGFFYASEASNSLKELVGGGSVTASLTDFYDCPSFWKKQLVSKPEGIKIYNACCNLLACCTFSHLKMLIPDEEITGGFASRLIYVVHDEIVIRKPKLVTQRKDTSDAKKLFEDLTQIYSLAGAFTPTPDFAKAYEEWFPVNDAYIQSQKSEKMQHLMARKHTNVLKLAMICSASESNSLTLELRHWERALDLMNKLETKLPKVLNSSIDMDKQSGITYAVLDLLRESGGTLERSKLIEKMIQLGIQNRVIETTLGIMSTGHLIAIERNDVTKSQRYRLLTNPQDYL